MDFNSLVTVLLFYVMAIGVLCLSAGLVIGLWL